MSEIGTVTTVSGGIKGSEVPGGWAFKGIPFAAAPVGKLRFAAPERPPSWDGTRDCTEWGPSCPQPKTMVPLHEVPYPVPPHWETFFNTLLGPTPDEDCLSLNVFTPGLDDHRRPTMVWLHPGGFRVGGAATPIFGNGSFLPDDVVLVTVNYRLNIFGALYLDEDFAGAHNTGNLANLDHVAALEWVQENIAAFGGDPGNVTIFGQSAGGTYVTMLLSMPAADGLYNKAIAQSASRVMVTPDDARTVALNILELLEVKPGDWDALRAVPAEQMMTLLDSGRVPIDSNGIVALLPIVGGDVLPKEPIEAIAGGSAHGTPVIIGTTNEEWRGFWTGSPPGAIFPRDVAAPFRNSGVSIDSFRRYYAERGNVDESAFLAAFDTDLIFRVPTMQITDALAETGSSVWAYRLDWAPELEAGSAGAFHGLDLALVFQALDDPRSVGDNPPVELANAMHDAWVAFARNGNPEYAGSLAWPKYDTTARTTMLFDTPSHAEVDPDHDTRLLWQNAVTGLGTAAD